jgi:hypothetical protein
MIFSLIGLVSLVLVAFLLNGLRKKSASRYSLEFPVPDENILFDDRDHPL